MRRRTRRERLRDGALALGMIAVAPAIGAALAASIVATAIVLVVLSPDDEPSEK